VARPTCSTCKHFRTNWGGASSGICGIELPPHLNATVHPETDCSTSASNSCSLHSPMPQPVDPEDA